MELREKNLILFLIILITDYCYKPKLTEAFLPDSATAGSRERRFVVNERLRISEDEEAIWSRRRERRSSSNSTPVLITQQEQRRLRSLPYETSVISNFYTGNLIKGILSSNLEPLKVGVLQTGQLSPLTALPTKTGSAYGNGGGYFMEEATPEMQVWQGNMAGFGTYQMPQEQSNLYSSGYGAVPNAGVMPNGGASSSYAGYLEKQINTYPIMLYTLNDCIPCQRAKHMLALSYPDVHAHFLELSGNEPWQQQLQIDLQYLTGAITFPYIFVCGQYIGGASDLFEWHETGQLRRALSQCIKTTAKTISL